MRMRGRFAPFFVGVTLLLCLLAPAGKALARTPFQGWTLTSVSRAQANDYSSEAEVDKAKRGLCRRYLRDIASRKGELGSGSLAIGKTRMRVSVERIGKPGRHGYPLYIALRGGGTESERDADEQFEVMRWYYRGAISSGIYVVPHGVCASWDEHYRPESFLFYDRIIEDAIAFYDVDPNRIYLIGFSSGGDGVYSIAPRMADRFAAVNMSAGYPHVNRMANLSNLPICLQMGQYDSDWGRNEAVVTYDGRLDELERRYGGLFEHETFVHVGAGHNDWSDYDGTPQEVVSEADVPNALSGKPLRTEWRNTDAVAWVSARRRDPLPTKLVWEPSVYAGLRDSQAFYWLDRGGAITNASIVASYDRKANSVTIDADAPLSGTIKVYLSPEMLDVFRSVRFNVGGGHVDVRPMVSRKTMRKTLYGRGDPSYVFTSEIDLRFDAGRKEVTVAPVATAGSDYEPRGVDQLLSWDEDGVFHVHQDLFGLTFQELAKKTGLTLSHPQPWPYWGNDLTWTYCDDLGKQTVVFMFQKGRCVIIYSEAGGPIPQRLSAAATYQFGPDGGAFSCGGLCRYYLENNFFDGADHAQQRHVSYRYKE